MRLHIADANTEGRKVGVRELHEGAVRDGLHGEINDRGWFDASSYSRDGASSQHLTSIIRLARGRQAEVVVILRPERSDLRSKIPGVAMEFITETLSREFGDDPPPLINLRDAAPDEDFHDTLHLKQSGRLMESRRLVEALMNRPHGRADCSPPSTGQ